MSVIYIVGWLVSANCGNTLTVLGDKSVIGEEFLRPRNRKITTNWENWLPKNSSKTTVTLGGAPPPPPPLWIRHRGGSRNFREGGATSPPLSSPLQPLHSPPLPPPFSTPLPYPSSSVLSPPPFPTPPLPLEVGPFNPARVSGGAL